MLSTSPPVRVGIVGCGSFGRNAYGRNLHQCPDALARMLGGQVTEVLATVEAVAWRSGSTVGQIALKWVLSHPEVTCAISGADTDIQMSENLAAVDVTLAPGDRRLLDEASAGLAMLVRGEQAPPARGPV